MNEEEHSFASDIDDSNGDEVGFITYEEDLLWQSQDMYYVAKKLHTISTSIKTSMQEHTARLWQRPAFCIT